MPSSFNILAASLISDPLRSAALILLLLMALMIIALTVPLNIRLYMCKEERLMEGRLMASWLGSSAGSELKRHDSLIQGGVWISCLGINLFKREISAPSDLDFISSFTESRRFERQRDKGEHYKSQQASAGYRNGSEVEEDGSRISISLFWSVMAAIPAFVDLFGDLLRSFFFKTIRCHVQLGLDDPCETAIMGGRLWSLAALLRCHGADIIIQPFFEGEKLEGEFLAEGGFRPIHITAAILSALRKKEVRSLINQASGWGKGRDED